MEDYRTYLVEKGFSAYTVESYLFAIRQLNERFGTKLTNEGLLAHKDWLAAHFAAKTVNLRITAINSYLDFTEFQGIRLKSLRIQQKPYLDNVISQEEYVLMRDALLQDGELFWHYVVRFLTCTGARISELRMFTVESVRIGHLDIISKGQKLRRIYIPSRLQHDAEDWLDMSERTDGYLFASNGDKPMTSRGISMGLKRYAEKYGINQDVVYPHSFRHRFAKNFIERNPDISLLADLMGHESLETTRIYLRRTASEQRAAVDAAIDW
ncbi:MULTISPECIES: tyrosine-type recombinase/integrase [unclassified Adlercreutzia]|uniref:tyrosine-type recombinase/integrase n=1 Tax=unclassified Adlercreutzia TaxID=2636013 RepID=UPI0013EE0AE4|nr:MULTISPECIES: tyrosine-type recombinase/integrase [unclassified Adlercreutzia]